jgi:hypothetical protein
MKVGQTHRPSLLLRATVATAAGKVTFVDQVLGRVFLAHHRHSLPPDGAVDESRRGGARRLSWRRPPVGETVAAASSLKVESAFTHGHLDFLNGPTHPSRMHGTNFTADVQVREEEAPTPNCEFEAKCRQVTGPQNIV